MKMNHECTPPFEHPEAPSSLGLHAVQLTPAPIMLGVLLLATASHAETDRGRAAHFGVGPTLCGCARRCNITWTDFRIDSETHCTCDAAVDDSDVLCGHGEHDSACHHCSGSDAGRCNSVDCGWDAGSCKRRCPGDSPPTCTTQPGDRLAGQLSRAKFCHEHRFDTQGDGEGEDMVTFTVGTPCQDLVDDLLSATMNGPYRVKDAMVTPITCAASAVVDVEPFDPLTKFVDAMFALGVILAVPNAVFTCFGWSYCCRSSCCPPAMSQHWSQRTVMRLNLSLGLVVFCCLLTSWIVDSHLQCPIGGYGCLKNAVGGKVYRNGIFSAGAYVSGIAALIAVVSMVTSCCMCGAPATVLVHQQCPPPQMNPPVVVTAQVVSIAAPQ